MKRLTLTAFLVALLGVAVLPAGRASAAVDISGQWNMTLLHPDVIGAINCSATVTQGGSNLTVPIVCDQLASGTLTGTIDTSTGQFTLSGSIPNPMYFIGTAAQDGDSMSGYWVVDPVPASGTFSGIRTSSGAGVGGVAELADVSVVRTASSDEARAGVPLVVWLAGGVAIGGGAALALRRR
jgi:hypothetical protein